MKRRHLGRISIGICGLAWAALAAGSDGQAPTQPPPGQPPAAAAPKLTPLDQAILWLHDAKRNHGAVKDYTCTMVSRENIKGKLREESIVQMKFRVQPFSVYMRWLSPTESRGQEVAFVAGRNKNMMRVHSKGLLKGAIGFVSIDPNDPRVMEHSRHTIREAGLGQLIDSTLAYWQADKRFNRTETRIAEYEYDNRRCLRIENIRPDRRPEYYAHRSVLFLDKESKLPVRNENYFWPRPGGPPTGELMEVYSYIDLRFNVGLTDRDFNK
ncbi:MAG: DUF1571 domain-containing protein [Gemmataceae bacterium]|nr:DUF1571 domain-containing protein [Gemmataceae bacterium]